MLTKRLIPQISISTETMPYLRIYRIYPMERPASFCECGVKKRVMG
jgi:hypothetical protein